MRSKKRETATWPSADEVAAHGQSTHARLDQPLREELLRSVAKGTEGALPETVLAMVQSRLESLEPADRKVLRAASVFGQVFWDTGIHALLGGSVGIDAVRASCATLAERELLARRTDGGFPGSQEYPFHHALVREASYAMLTAEDRSVGHRLAGLWLETSGEVDALALAEHFQNGREPGRAVRWYLRAAQHALEETTSQVLSLAPGVAGRCRRLGPR